MPLLYGRDTVDTARKKQTINQTTFHMSEVWCHTSPLSTPLHTICDINYGTLFMSSCEIIMSSCEIIMSSCEIKMLTCEIIISTCETQEASPLQASSPIESFAHGLSLLDQRDGPLLSFTPFLQ